MKKVFGNLRLKSIHLKDLLRYLVYAVGEIFLIVIGILIALQLGDWNDNKKSLELQRKILSDLKAEIQTNVEGMDYVIQQKKDIVSICQIFLEKTGPDTKWDLNLDFDSLLVKTLVSGWKFKPQNGVMNDILNSGKLGIIKNDSLRYAISSIPGYTARFQFEDDMVINDLHNSFLPFITKYYPIKNTNDHKSGGLQRKHPTAILKSKHNIRPEILLNNLEFENQINIQMLWVNFSIFHYNQQQKKYKEIITLIDKELSK